MGDLAMLLPHVRTSVVASQSETARRALSLETERKSIGIKVHWAACLDSKPRTASILLCFSMSRKAALGGATWQERRNVSIFFVSFLIALVGNGEEVRVAYNRKCGILCLAECRTCELTQSSTSEMNLSTACTINTSTREEWDPASSCVSPSLSLPYLPLWSSTAACCVLFGPLIGAF